MNGKTWKFRPNKHTHRLDVQRRVCSQSVGVCVCSVGCLMCSKVDAIILNGNLLYGSVNRWAMHRWKSNVEILQIALVPSLMVVRVLDFIVSPSPHTNPHFFFALSNHAPLRLCHSTAVSNSQALFYILNQSSLFFVNQLFFSVAITHWMIFRFYFAKSKLSCCVWIQMLAAHFKETKMKQKLFCLFYFYWLSFFYFKFAHNNEIECKSPLLKTANHFDQWAFGPKNHSTQFKMWSIKKQVLTCVRALATVLSVINWLNYN